MKSPSSAGRLPKVPSEIQLSSREASMHGPSTADGLKRFVDSAEPTGEEVLLLQSHLERSGDTPEQQRRDHDSGIVAGRVPTTIMVNLASILEKTDEQLLPSVYKYVACSFNARPEQLGYVTMSRAVCQALASPIGGLLGHHYDRSWVIAAGCFIWAFFTFFFSFTTAVGWGAFAWAWNGIGLSFVIPNTQSLTADYFDELSRGKAFGALYSTGALGGMVGTAFATNVAGYTIMGMEGWRWAFRCVATAACMIGVATLVYAKDPNHTPQAKAAAREEEHSATASSTFHDFCQVLRVRTFQIIIVQGILGSTPWNALVFLTIYLQLTGFTNMGASIVLTCFLFGAAIGGFLGGFVGDIAARVSPDHGRIYVCQFSVFMGIPFSCLVLKGLPRNGDPATVVLYALTVFVWGAVHVWAAPACNNPVFAEIVPGKLRNLVYSFDRSFEGALAAMGAPLVGIIAERVFDFPTDSPSYECDARGQPIESGDDLAGKAGKAVALGNAMLVCMVVPWALCLCVYSLLHWTYPADRRQAQEDAKRAQLAASVMGRDPMLETIIADADAEEPSLQRLCSS